MTSGQPLRGRRRTFWFGHLCPHAFVHHQWREPEDPTLETVENEIGDVEEEGMIGGAARSA
jgi:hypothetical protein